MSDMIYVRPAEAGAMVPDPAMQGGSDQVRLPPEGRWVRRSTYWDRCINRADVIHEKDRVWVEPPPEPAPTPASEGDAQGEPIGDAPPPEPALEAELLAAAEPEPLPNALKSKRSRGDQ
jgi:hypothetical protein